LVRIDRQYGNRDDVHARLESRQRLGRGRRRQRRGDPDPVGPDARGARPRRARHGRTPPLAPRLTRDRVRRRRASPNVFSSADAKFVVLAFSSLFSVINPIEAAPIFVAMTRGMEDRRRTLALRASMAAALILSIFALTGGAIFAFFGITLPAFQIAGGIL